jgi:hypothetical protein
MRRLVSANCKTVRSNQPVSESGNILPRIPFPADKGATEFTLALMGAVRERTDMLIGNVLSQENIQTFYHGEGWIDQGDDTPHGTFQLSQVEHLINAEDIANFSLSVLLNFIEAMAQGLFTNMMQVLYARVNEAVESTGNVVSVAEAGSTAAAFLQMLRKLEFGVDKEGKVSLPQFHLDLEKATKLEAELKNQGRAFHLEAEVIKSEKIANALRREQQRLAKFKGFTEAK